MKNHMDTHKFLQIGEAAKLFHLSVGSLRHYETLGLLTPEAIDPNTGYRYYSVRQFEALNTIRYLRALDMPLPAIADFMQNRDVEKIEEKLRQQKETVLRKQRELRRIGRKIDNRLRWLHDAQTKELDAVQFCSLPSCRLVWMKNSLKIHGWLDMEAPIRKLEQSQAEPMVFLGKVGVSISEENLRANKFDQYDGIFLVLDDEDRFSGKTLLLPKTAGVSVRFCGSHPEAPEQYCRLMTYIREHNMNVAGFSREITMIDYGVTNDTQKFVTEISIPVTMQQRPA